MQTTRKQFQGRSKQKLFSSYLLFSLFIGLVLSVLSFRYIEVADNSLIGPLSLIYIFAYSFFYYAVLIFAILSPLLIFSFLGFRRLFSYLTVMIASIVVILFLADSFVYQQFRMHLNLAMLQMTLFGYGQVVQFDTKMWIEIILISLVCFLSTTGLFLIASSLSKRLNKKFCVLAITFVLLGSISCQLIFGFSFAKNISQVTQVSYLLPLNRPLRFNKLLVKIGAVSKEEVRRFDLNSKKGLMNYPINPLVCKGGNNYNILFLFVDSLRFDMVAQDTMPNIFEFSSSAIRFPEHFSGGINTRHGIFSLFTGLPGLYWEKSLQTHSGSALITALQSRGYQIGLFSSAPLTMPEFNKTIFTDIHNLRESSKGANTLERDENAISDLSNWLKKRDPSSPFFAFLFLDAVHSTQFPEGKENEKFKPYWKNVNQLELSNDFDASLYFNRYKNSVHFVDSQLGKLLKKLPGMVDLDQTIIVISSDHGEEFNDNKLNYWGHNGNFTKYQAQVPFIVKWPGKENISINYRTSMLDVVPTILQEVLGCENPIDDYSLGKNLFSPDEKRKWLYVSNYSNDAFLEENRIVLINELGILQFLDPHYRPSKDQTIPPYFSQILKDSSRYAK